MGNVVKNAPGAQNAEAGVSRKRPYPQPQVRFQRILPFTCRLEIHIHQKEERRGKRLSQRAQSQGEERPFGKKTGAAILLCYSNRQSIGRVLRNKCGKRQISLGAVPEPKSRTAVETVVTERRRGQREVTAGIRQGINRCQGSSRSITLTRGTLSPVKGHADKEGVKGKDVTGMNRG